MNQDPNGNDLAAKGAFPAWTRGGIGFALSPALEPLEAEAQEATGTAAAPAAATGTHGMQRRQGRRTLAMSDATAAMNGATSDERARNQKGPRPPQRLQRNRGSVCFRTPDRAI